MRSVYITNNNALWGDFSGKGARCAAPSAEACINADFTEVRWKGARKGIGCTLGCAIKG